MNSKWLRQYANHVKLEMPIVDSVDFSRRKEWCEEACGNNWTIVEESDHDCWYLPTPELASFFVLAFA